MARFYVDELALREPNLLLPGVKPLGPVKINWSNPITEGLVAFVLTGPVPYEVVHNLPLAHSGDTPHGKNTDFPGVENNRIVVPKRYMDAVVAAQAQTVMQKYSQHNNTNPWQGPSGCFNAGSSIRNWNLWTASASSIGHYVAETEGESYTPNHSVLSTYNPFPDGNIKHTLAGVWENVVDSATDHMGVWIDGVESNVRNSTAVTETIPTPTLDINIGNASQNSTGDSLDGEVEWWGLWARRLYAEHIEAMHDDYTQILTLA